MKRHVFSIIVVSLTLAILWSTFVRAQEAEAKSRLEPGKEPPRPMAEGARPADPRRGASERAPQGFSAEDRERMRERYRSMSAEERERFRSEMRGRFGPGRGALVLPNAPGAFEQQVEQLTKEHEQTVAELNEILQLAYREKARRTAARIQALIAKRQKAFEEKVQVLRQRRQRLEQMRPERRPGRTEQPRLPRGKTAPDFTLASFDGKETALAKLKGKIVVLEWMNFECPFSIYHYETKTTMVDLAKKYKDKGVTWLVVNSTNHTKPEANTAFAKKYKLPYPVLNDIPGKVGKAYGAKTTPHMFVIDKTGAIAYDGAIDNAPMGKVAKDQKYVCYVSDALDALVADKRVTTAQTKPYGCSVKYAQ